MTYLPFGVCAVKGPEFLFESFTLELPSSD